MTVPSILFLTSDLQDLDLLNREARQAGTLSFTPCPSGAHVAEQLEHGGCVGLLIDSSLPESVRRQTIGHARAACPSAPIVVLVSPGDGGRALTDGATAVVSKRGPFAGRLVGLFTALLETGQGAAVLGGAESHLLAFGLTAPQLSALSGASLVISPATVTEEHVRLTDGTVVDPSGYVAALISEEGLPQHASDVLIDIRGKAPLLTLVALTSDASGVLALTTERLGGYSLSANDRDLAAALQRVLPLLQARRASIEDMLMARASEFRVRAVVESAPASILLLDGDGTCLAMNWAGLAILGYDDGHDVVGVDFRDRLDAESVSSFNDLLHSVRDGGRADARVSCRNSRGDWLHLCIHGVPLSRGDDEVNNVLCSISPLDQPEGPPALSTKTDQVGPELERRSHEVAFLREQVALLRTELDSARLAASTAGERLTEFERQAGETAQAQQRCKLLETWLHEAEARCDELQRELGSRPSAATADLEPEVRRLRDALAAAEASSEAARQQVSAAELRTRQLEAQCTEVGDRLREERSRLERLDAAAVASANLERQLAAHREAHESTVEELRSTCEERDELAARVASLQDELEAERTRAEAERQHHVECRPQTDDLRSRVSTLSAALAEAHGASAAQETVLRAISEERDGLIERLAAATTTEARLRERIEDLERAHAGALADRASAALRCTELQGAAAASARALAAEQRARSAAEETVVPLRRDLEDLGRQHQATLATLAATRGETDRHREQHQAALQEVTRLLASLAQERTEHAAVEQALAELRAERDATLSASAAAQQALRDALDAASADREAAHAALASVKAERDAARTANESLGAERNQLATERSLRLEADEALAHLRRELEELRVDYQAATTRLDAVRAQEREASDTRQAALDELQHVTADLARERSERTATEQALVSLRKERDSLASERSEIAARLAEVAAQTLRDGLSEPEGGGHGPTAAVALLKTHIGELEAQLAAADARSVEAEAHVVPAAQQLLEARHLLADSERRLAELEPRLEESTRQLEAADLARQFAEVDRDRLALERDELATERDRSAEQLTAAVEERDRLRAQVAQLIADCSRRTAECDRLRAAERMTETARLQQVEQQRRAQRELDALHAANRQWQDRFDQAEEQLMAMRASLAAEKQARRADAAQHADWRARAEVAERLQDELDRALEELAAQRRRLDEYRDLNMSLESGLRSAEAALEQLADTQRQERSRAEAQRKELDRAAAALRDRDRDIQRFKALAASAKEQADRQRAIAHDEAATRRRLERDLELRTEEEAHQLERLQHTIAEVEGRLRDEQERWVRSWSDAPVGLCVTTRDGRLLSCNTTLGSWLCVDSGASTAAIQLPGVSLEPGESLTREIRVRRHDGRTVHLLERATCWKRDNEPVVDRTMVDQTRSHELAAELRDARRVESVGRLAVRMVDDLWDAAERTDNLLRDIEGAVGSAAYTAFADLAAVAGRTRELVRQLQQHAHHRLKSEPECQPLAVVQSLLPILRRVSGEDVCWEVDNTVETTRVEVDRHAFEHLLTSFAVAVREALPEGGKATIGPLTAPQPGSATADEQFPVLRLTTAGYGLCAPREEGLTAAVARCGATLTARRSSSACEWRVSFLASGSPTSPILKELQPNS